MITFKVRNMAEGKVSRPCLLGPNKLREIEDKVLEMLLKDLPKEVWAITMDLEIRLEAETAIGEPAPWDVQMFQYKTHVEVPQEVKVEPKCEEKEMVSKVIEVPMGPSGQSDLDIEIERLEKRR